jgi:CheY-like chemotaxis protein
LTAPRPGATLREQGPEDVKGLPVRVLIVDDDADLLTSVSLVLEDRGNEVSSACNGRDALQWLQQTSTQPDLILLDLMMPVMDGWAFRRAQCDHPTFRSIPVVVFTAVGNIQNRADLGDVRILHKPFDVEDLENVLKDPQPDKAAS